MNYYEHHLGDYAAATAHLSLLEDAVYSRLLRRYYLQEQPLPADVARLARLCGAHGSEELAAVEVVLQEFFELQADGWHNKRADAEVERYKDKQAKARASADARWNKPGKRPSCERTASALPAHDERDAYQSPDTSLSSSLRSEEVPRSAGPSQRPGDVSEQIWSDWVALRKAKRAPVTATVLSQARNEAEKAGMAFEPFLAVWCARGSQGLQADWLKPHERGCAQLTQVSPTQAAKSKTLSAIQQLQSMKHGHPLDPRRDSGRLERVALPRA